MDVCTAHRRHPLVRPLYVEYHHVIPQGWQRTWQPIGPPPFPGPGDKGPLWDARTVPLCRTGHGNVHYLLVATMRQLAAVAGADPVKTMEAQRRRLRAGRVEAAIAMEAIARFQDVHGPLAVLFTAGQWGEI